jgi:hypothetical protein
VLIAPRPSCLPRFCPQLLALLTTPLQALLGPSLRQASTFLVIMALGMANVYLK